MKLVVINKLSDEKINALKKAVPGSVVEAYKSPKEALPHVADADAIALCQAVTTAADGLGFALADLRQQPAGRQRTAQAQTVEAVAVGAVKAWRAKQLLHHHRRTVELGAALIANQVEGFVDVPLVHQQQASPAAQRE